jgi:hypothetical protein
MSFAYAAFSGKTVVIKYGGAAMTDPALKVRLLPQPLSAFTHSLTGGRDT